MYLLLALCVTFARASAYVKVNETSFQHLEDIQRLSSVLSSDKPYTSSWLHSEFAKPPVVEGDTADSLFLYHHKFSLALLLTVVVIVLVTFCLFCVLHWHRCRKHPEDFDESDLNDEDNEFDDLPSYSQIAVDEEFPPPHYYQIFGHSEIPKFCTSWGSYPYVVMITLTGKLCALSGFLMLGLVFVWICHVCCRNLWCVILSRLESSSRFSRILELSEINRERLHILPRPTITLSQFISVTCTGTSITTTTCYHHQQHQHNGSTSPSAGAGQNNTANTSTQAPQMGQTNQQIISRYPNPRDRPRPRELHHVLVASTSDSGAVVTLPSMTITMTSSSTQQEGPIQPAGTRRIAYSTYVITSSDLPDRTQVFQRQDTQSTCDTIESNSAPPPSYFSTESVVSEPTLSGDVRQGTPASANSPPPSYHSNDSIAWQSTVTSGKGHALSHQPSDSSDGSVSPTALSAQHRLGSIAETDTIRRAGTLIRSQASTSEVETVVVAPAQLPPPPTDELPPSYEELFGEST